VSSPSSGKNSATAFAPASAANVAIGFDILGFSVDVLGDKVSVKRTDKPGVVIAGSSGVVKEIPRDPERNTAGRALLAMQEVLKPGFGFEVFIEKGIPLAVVSEVRRRRLSLPSSPPMRCSTSRCPRSSCCSSPCRAKKSRVASLHVDNISPSLFGGLVLTVGIDHPRVKQIPVPEGIRAVLVHPHLFLSTKQARGILKREVTMSDFIWQTANLAGFISGCYTNDLDMIRASFEDVVIEKQRSQLIPGFDRCARARSTRARWAARFPAPAHDVRVGARERCRESARRHGERFGAANMKVDHWIVPITTAGAHVLPADA
jgi:homoserine kinase